MQNVRTAFMGRIVQRANVLQWALVIKRLSVTELALAKPAGMTPFAVRVLRTTTVQTAQAATFATSTAIALRASTALVTATKVGVISHVRNVQLDTSIVIAIHAVFASWELAMKV